MAWIAVSEGNWEEIFENKPERNEKTKSWVDFKEVNGVYVNTRIDLSDGTIKKLIGKELVWESEPVEI